jgi:hypothetical protein
MKLARTDLQRTEYAAVSIDQFETVINHDTSTQVCESTQTIRLGKAEHTAEGASLQLRMHGDVHKTVFTKPYSHAHRSHHVSTYA